MAFAGLFGLNLNLSSKLPKTWPQTSPGLVHTAMLIVVMLSVVAPVVAALAFTPVKSRSQGKEPA
jgi:hypothetical protein